MRRFLPLLLLIAVCFNTAWGWPAHQASHGLDHAPQAHGHAEGLAADEASTPPQESTPDPAAHAACAACVAHAQQSLAPTAPWRGPGPGPMQVGPHGCPGAGCPAADGHRWPFASRDPPATASR